MPKEPLSQNGVKRISPDNWASRNPSRRRVLISALPIAPLLRWQVQSGNWHHAPCPRREEPCISKLSVACLIAESYGALGKTGLLSLMNVLFHGTFRLWSHDRCARVPSFKLQRPEYAQEELQLAHGCDKSPLKYHHNWAWRFSCSLERWDGS